MLIGKPFKSTEISCKNTVCTIKSYSLCSGFVQNLSRHLQSNNCYKEGSLMLSVAEKLEDKSFFLHLNIIPNMTDAMANEVKSYLLKRTMFT